MAKPRKKPAKGGKVPPRKTGKDAAGTYRTRNQPAGGRGNPTPKVRKQAIMGPCPNKGRAGTCGLCGGENGKHNKYPSVY